MPIQFPSFEELAEQLSQRLGEPVRPGGLEGIGMNLNNIYTIVPLKLSMCATGHESGNMRIVQGHLETNTVLRKVDLSLGSPFLIRYHLDANRESSYLLASIPNAVRAVLARLLELKPDAHKVEDDTWLV